MSVTDDPETTWFRADLWGLAPREWATPTNDGYVYATSDLDAARAYATKREDQTKARYAVYRVELNREVFQDPDYPDGSGFVRCLSATLAEMVEKQSTMPLDEANKYMLDHCWWREDNSPMYDADGYPTASPEMRRASIGAEELRQLGRYPMPDVVQQTVRHILAD